MVAAVINQEPAVRDPGPSGAARALRARLSDQTTLTGAERHLLGEWLDRLADDRHGDDGLTADGLANDGLANDGLANDGLANDGLVNDG
ncbi:hypothetical protein OK074_1213 [Actinobacteria bacterium OK074]|nr:hypothetical protein OK074_1213 [Actinobacteria bacterium OK074]